MVFGLTSRTSRLAATLRLHFESYKETHKKTTKLMDADAQSLEEKAVLKEHWRRHATITHRTNLRTVLSVSSRVYDLLGLISPAVIQTRILQRIWCRRLDWDQELPVEIKRKLWQSVDQLKRPVARIRVKMVRQRAGDEERKSYMSSSTPARKPMERWLISAPWTTLEGYKSTSLEAELGWHH